MAAVLGGADPAPESPAPTPTVVLAAAVGVYPVELSPGKEHRLTLPLAASGPGVGPAPRHTLKGLFKHIHGVTEKETWVSLPHMPALTSVLVHPQPSKANAPPAHIYTIHVDGNWYDANFNQVNEVELPWFITIRLPANIDMNVVVDIAGALLLREELEVQVGAQPQDYRFGTRMVAPVSLKDAKLGKVDGLTLLAYPFPADFNAPPERVLTYYASVDGWYDRNFQWADKFQLEPARGYVLRVPGRDTPASFIWEREMEFPTYSGDMSP